MAIQTPTRGAAAVIQVLIVVAVLVVIAIVALNSGVFQREVSGNQRVGYQIQGTASQAWVTYTLPDLNVSEPEFVDLPWRSPTLVIPGENRVILTAANPEDSGTLECVILVNGSTWRQESVPATQDKISCGGLLP